MTRRAYTVSAIRRTEFARAFRLDNGGVRIAIGDTFLDAPDGHPAVAPALDPALDDDAFESVVFALVRAHFPRNQMGALSIRVAEVTRMRDTEVDRA